MITKIQFAMASSKLVLEILLIISTEPHSIKLAEKVGVATLLIKCGCKIELLQKYLWETLTILRYCYYMVTGVWCTVYVHAHVHIHIHVHLYMYIKAWTKVGKQPSKLLQQKTNDGSKVCTCFYQCSYYLEWL